MHYISYPATSVESRWRPDGQMGMSLSGWTPAQRQSWSQSRMAGKRIAQKPTGARETPTELMISVGTALAATTAGLILTFGAPKGKTTLMWIGILTGTIGGLKLLQTGSKIA